MPSTELNHSGVYQLEVISKADRMERSVNHVVKQQCQEYNSIGIEQRSFSSIPVEEFGDYVHTCHVSSNAKLKDQFTVSAFFV